MKEGETDAEARPCPGSCSGREARRAIGNRLGFRVPKMCKRASSRDGMRPRQYQIDSAQRLLVVRWSAIWLWVLPRIGCRATACPRWLAARFYAAPLRDGLYWAVIAPSSCVSAPTGL